MEAKYNQETEQYTVTMSKKEMGNVEHGLFYAWISALEKARELRKAKQEEDASTWTRFAAEYLAMHDEVQEVREGNY